MGDLTYSGPSLSDSAFGTGTTDPAPSFGTGGGTDWAKTAGDFLKGVGGIADTGFSLYNKFRGPANLRDAGNPNLPYADAADPGATSEASKTPLAENSKIPTWAIAASVGAGVLLLVLLLKD